MELIELTRLMQNQVWLCSGRVQHRDNGGCPCNPRTEAKQFSFGLYFWHPSSLTGVFKETFQRGPRLSAIERAWTLGTLVSGVSGSCQGGANRVHQDNADLCLAVWGEGSTQERWLQLSVWEEDSIHRQWQPSLQLLHGSHTAQGSLSLYVSGTPSPTCHRPVPSPESKASACEQDFVHWPFKRKPEFPADFCLALSPGQTDKGFPADFHGQMLHGSTDILDRGAWHGAETLCSSRGTSVAEISL